MSLETLQAELYWAQQQLAQSAHKVDAALADLRENKRQLNRIKRRLAAANQEHNHHTDAVRGIEQAIIDSRKDVLT